jgi:hypothetical protein
MFARYRAPAARRKHPGQKILTLLLALSFLGYESLGAAAQIQTGPIQPLPSSSGSAGPLVTPMASDANDRNKLWQRDSLGRPCLQITAEARSQPATPNIFDHIVVVNNRCLQRIKVKLCYYKSEHCLTVEMAANQRKETILGTYPAMRYFRYEYQEQR